MPRSENYSQESLYFLVQLLESRPELVSGELGGEIKTHADQRKAWEDVTNKLNLVSSGVIRTAKQVKSKWNDLKYRTRVKAGLKENSYYVPDPSKKLSPLDKKILSLIYPNHLENVPMIEKTFSLLNKEQMESLVSRNQETTSENDSGNESSRLGEWENTDNKKITIINISPAKEINSTTLEIESSHPAQEISSINISPAKEINPTILEVESSHSTKEISSININPLKEISSINISPSKEINSTILEIESSQEKNISETHAQLNDSIPSCILPEISSPKKIMSSADRVRKFRNKRRLEQQLQSQLQSQIENQIIETQSEMSKDIKRIKMSLVEISDNLIEIKEAIKSSLNNQNMLIKVLCSSLGINIDKYKKT